MENKNEDLLKIIAIYKQNLAEAHEKVIRLQVHCANLMTQVEELKNDK